MFIKEDNYGLKTIEYIDLEWIKELRNDMSTWQHLEHVFPLNMLNQEGWLKAINNDNSKEYYIFNNDSNQNLGLVRITDIDLINRKACIGLDMHSNFRGKGLSLIAYRILLNYLFKYKNLNRVYLFVLSDNTVAINLYKKLGFVKEGIQREAIIRNGKKIDYIMMSMLFLDYNNDERYNRYE